MLTGAFLAHEAKTQLRSARFRTMAGVYVVVSCVPAALVFFIARRADYAIGSAAYASLLEIVQPFLTMLFVGLISIDAVMRERDEGSFPVVSLAPVGAAGYLMRRWLAVVMMTLPLTLLPPIIAAVLSAVQRKQPPMFAAFAWGWALHVLPVAVIVSAFALAMGTITGSVIVALIVSFMLFTFGLEIANDLLAHMHRQFDGPDLLMPDRRKLQELEWTVRGYYRARLPTEAAYPLRESVEEMVPRGALFLGLGAFLLGISTLYLRRTRRDLRPWRTRADHPLRSFIATANRLRTEYSPDGSIAAAEWVAVAGGAAALIAVMLFLSRRAIAFEHFGTEKYKAYTQRDPLPMSADIAPALIRVRGALTRDGAAHVRAELALRNNGSVPVSHLGFALNPLMPVTGLRASAGRARIARVWERVGIDVDPPLAAGETRTLVFDLDGKPGDVWLPIWWSGGFRSKWHRYITATNTVDLSDLSRSAFVRNIDEARVALSARDIVPVPRYSPWVIDKDTDTFARETIEPAAEIDVELQQPFGTVADSCGHVAVRAAALQIRCTMSLPSYRIAGGPLITTSVANGVTLAYIPAHEALARVQSAALASGVTRAEEAWPNLQLARPIVYVENPTRQGEDIADWREARRIGGSGTLQLIPENLFTRHEGIDGSVAAASLITNSLRTRRRVIPDQAGFFMRFYEMTVGRRLAPERSVRAVLPASGDTAFIAHPPIVDYDAPRLPYIAAAIEARAGANHVVDGINDFVAAGPRAGTARELFDDIGRRAGIDLTRMYEDFVEGMKTPKLTFEGVTFRRAGGAWEVRGVLRNDGTGESVCPIALRTAAGSQWQTLRADSGEKVPFVFTTTAAPHTLQLDPDRVCFRLGYIGATESVDYRGES
jgi:ABC-type transport system involved in multi-copper enzyme maturation permease subunit